MHMRPGQQLSRFFQASCIHASASRHAFDVSSQPSMRMRPGRHLSRFGSPQFVVSCINTPVMNQASQACSCAQDSSLTAFEALGLLFRASTHAIEVSSQPSHAHAPRTVPGPLSSLLRASSHACDVSSQPSMRMRPGRHLSRF